MKHRSVLAVICFSIITFGIYDLFWLATTKKELNTRTKVHVPSLWLLFVPALIAVIAVIIAIANSPAQTTDGTMATTSGGSAAVLVIAWIVFFLSATIIPVYWFLKYSKAVNEYTNGEINTAVSFILLWILRFIGIAVIQDKFNDMLAAGVVPMSSPTPSAAWPVPGASANPPIQTTPQPQPSQPPVDPTQPQSYEQQPPVSPQPPTPPSGPLVQ